MKIPNTLTECYEALGLIPLGTGDMSKRELEPKALYCRSLITSFLQLDGSNSIYEARDPLHQFQQRAETWVGFNASKLWAATDRADLFPGAPTYPRDKNMITGWILQVLAHRLKLRSKKENEKELKEQRQTQADALADALNPPKKTKWKKAEDMDPNDPRIVSHDNAEIFECLVTDSEAEQQPTKPKEAEATTAKEAIAAKKATAATPPAAKDKQPTTLAPPPKGVLKRPTPSSEGENAKHSKRQAKTKPTSEATPKGSSATNPIALTEAPPSTRPLLPTLPAALASAHQRPAQPLFPDLTAVHLDQTYILAKLSSSLFAEPLSLRACLVRPSIYDAVITKLGLAGRKHEILWVTAKFADCDVAVRIREREEDQELLLRYVASKAVFCFITVEVFVAN